MIEIKIKINRWELKGEQIPFVFRNKSNLARLWLSDMAVSSLA